MLLLARQICQPGEAACLEKGFHAATCGQVEALASSKELQVL
jgi:hypothetical protein